jgi:hypothetical protein
VTAYPPWEDVQQELLTDEEIAGSDKRGQRLMAQVYALQLAEIRRRPGLAVGRDGGDSEVW